MPETARIAPRPRLSLDQDSILGRFSTLISFLFSTPSRPLLDHDEMDCVAVWGRFVEGANDVLSFPTLTGNSLEGKMVRSFRDAADVSIAGNEMRQRVSRLEVIVPVAKKTGKEKV